MGELPLLAVIHGFDEVAGGDDPKTTNFAEKLDFFGPELETQVARRESVSSSSRLGFPRPFWDKFSLWVGAVLDRRLPSGGLGNVEWAFVGCLFFHQLASEFERRRRQRRDRARGVRSFAGPVLRVALPASVGISSGMPRSSRMVRNKSG